MDNICETIRRIRRACRNVAHAKCTHLKLGSNQTITCSFKTETPSSPDFTYGTIRVNKVREAIRCPRCRKSFPLPSGLISGQHGKVSLRDLTAHPKLLQVGDLFLNPTTYDATRSGKKIALSPIESRLLSSLMRRNGRAVSRKVLIRTIWGSDGYVEKNRLDVFICLLRNKVDRGHKAKLIKTIRNLGFVIRNPAKA